MADKTPYPSWEVFDECPTCYAGPKMPCLNMKKSTKNPVVALNPHHGRKMLKRDKYA